MEQVTRAGTSAAALVRVTDELDVATTPQLQRTIEQALRGRPQTLAVDLSGCPFAGCDAIETLVVLTAQARRQGTTLVLLGMADIVRRAISLLGRESDLYFGDAASPAGTRR